MTRIFFVIAFMMPGAALFAQTTVVVPPGVQAQPYIDAAAPGATIQLTAGAVYAGPIYLRGGGRTLTSAGFSVDTPVTPADAGQMAKVRAPDGYGAGIVIEGTGWSVIGVEVTGNANDLVVVGKTSVGTRLERLYIHGDPTAGAKRGIALNGAEASVVGCYVDGIFRSGQETSGIGGWDGPGPFLIEHNYLRAASINILFGGADPTTTGLVPSDITIRHNVLTKDLAWRGKGYAIKNVLELKNARRVTITDNTMENSWTDGQTGFAVVLTVRNTGGGCTWCTLEDIVLQRNIIRNVGAGISILGLDDDGQLTIRGRRLSIVDNTLSLCTTTFPGAGTVMLINNGPDDLKIRDNWASNCADGYVQSFMTFTNPSHQLLGFEVTGNTFPQGEYGLFGDGAAGLGQAVLDLYAPTAVWSNNTVVKTLNGRTINYPAGTTVVLQAVPRIPTGFTIVR